MSSSEAPVRVLVCCAFPARRDACARWVDAADDLELVGTRAGGEEVEVEGATPDVVIVDGDPEDPSVAAEIARVDAAHPQARILLYSQLDEQQLAAAADDAGAEPDGYLPSEADEARLLAAVRHLAEPEPAE